MRQDIREEREDQIEDGGDDAAANAGAAAEPSEIAEAPPDPEIDYHDRWLRAEAELQNIRRRSRREVDEVRRVTEETMLLELVAWLDDLERAIEAAAAGGASPSWVEGVSLLAQKGREYLERQGVKVIDAVGQAFDPNDHEAVLEVDAPQGAAPGSVVQVIQKGYRRHNRSLRPARVVVARSAADGS